MSLIIENPSRIPKEVIVFYCWQDQLDKKLHRYLIRDALNSAVGEVQNILPPDLDCTIALDSDTANRTGTVAICDTILEKIAKSTIVVADVTPVYKVKSRKLYIPNPNVMMEIGYAANALGWSRVNCICNSASCTPEQLPFDIRHRRITSYTCASSSNRADALKKLTATLVTVITATIRELDRGEFKESLNNSATTRKRDIRLLTDLLNTLHTPTFDRYIEAGLQQDYYDINEYFWIGFEAILCSSNFRFYDQKLERLVRELGGLWGHAEYLSGRLFTATHIPGKYRTKEHRFWTSEYERELTEFQNTCRAIAGKLRVFLDYIHTHYKEIDVTTTNQTAWERNLPHIRGDFLSAKGEENATINKT